MAQHILRTRFTSELHTFATAVTTLSQPQRPTGLSTVCFTSEDIRPRSLSDLTASKRGVRTQRQSGSEFMNLTMKDRLCCQLRTQFRSLSQKKARKSYSDSENQIQSQCPVKVCPKLQFLGILQIFFEGCGRTEWKNSHKERSETLSMVAQACTISTQEVEARRLQVQCWPRLLGNQEEENREGGRKLVPQLSY